MSVDKIKFGTDGWRAIIAKDFTVNNVARVSKAVADWLYKQFPQPVVVIGHDCRFGGELFAETTAKVLCENKVKVIIAKGFVSTPMVSFGVTRMKAHQGVVITASHNPPSYNGYKLKGAHGGPSNPADIAAVEELIPDAVEVPTTSLQEYHDKGLLEWVDLETMYCNYLKEKFDFTALNNSRFAMAYDAMYGAGQNVVRKLLPAAHLIHCEDNPSFMGQAPEPLHRNLQELSRYIQFNDDIKIGLATDGDADRIGLYDEDGNFVDAHHIILLLIHYLHKYQGMTGKVAVAFSTTGRVKKMCQAYGLPYEVTPIGFKYISEIMTREDVLVGGEESGGIAVKGHIPERDGIYDGLVLYEYMTKSGKTLKELCEEIYEVVGRFVFERNDLHLAEEKKQAIIANCKAGKYTSFGKYKVEKTEDLDGFKYHFDNGGWIMIRPSGTEPLLRIYAEGSSREEVLQMLETVQSIILA